MAARKDRAAYLLAAIRNAKRMGDDEERRTLEFAFDSCMRWRARDNDNDKRKKKGHRCN